MARPWKHPGSGIYWLRRSVPEDLRPLVGKREEKRSLKTRDPSEAKRLHAQAVTELEARWANLRAGPRALSEREAHELARVAHDRWLALHRDNPSEQTFWPVDVFKEFWGSYVEYPTPNPSGNELFSGEISKHFFKGKELEAWCLRLADQALADRGLVVDETSRTKLAKAIGAAIQRASLSRLRLAQGELDAHDGGTPRAPAEPDRRKASGDVPPPVRFDDLVKGWAAERRPAEKTRYEWSRVLRQFQAFLGHDDAGRVRTEDVAAWKTSLVEQGLKAKTIRDAKLVPVRAILGWAVDNHRLPTNPAERIPMGVKSKPAEAKRSFTDEEAATVLRAASEQMDPVRRWVPWLCAYSGARLSEVCQLRVEDIVLIDGIWCIKFDPEAGSLKAHASERAVPLHPAVIESGFLDFVRAMRSGPLFSDLPPDKFGNRGGNGTKVLGRWVRSLGLTDSRISPNHSWRHRLKTMGRRYGLAPDIVDAITGHGRKTVADSYSEFPMEALQRELSKIPALPSGPAERRGQARKSTTP